MRQGPARSLPSSIPSSIAILCVSLAACASRTQSPSAREAASSTATRSDGGGDGGGSVAQEERVRVPTRDGWYLDGALRSRSNDRVVVLIHGLGSHRRAWSPLIEALGDRGRANAPSTLAIDLRGHGESTQGPDGRITWQQFGNEPDAWAGIESDALAAIAYARHRFPRAHIVVAGAGLGAAAAVRAVRNDLTIQRVALLSPGLSDRGLDLPGAVGPYVARGGRLLAIGSRGDGTVEPAFAALTSPALRAVSQGRSSAVEIDRPDRGDAHGTDLLIDPGGRDTVQKLASWLTVTGPEGP